MFRLFATAGLAVVAWKVGALLLLASSTDGEGPRVVQVLLAVVGLVYVACGLLVLRKRNTFDALLFAGFCLCAGLHWGGPLELLPGELRTALLLFYLLVSSFLSETLFLHFALRFPHEPQPARAASCSRYPVWTVSTSISTRTPSTRR